MSESFNLSNKNRRPSRGEVWWAKLEPSKIHETVKTRPCLVVSVDQVNSGPANILIIIPIEFEDRGIASHIRVDRREVDIKATGFIQCEDIRMIPMDRVQSCAGMISAGKMSEVEETISLLLGLA